MLESICIRQQPMYINTTEPLDMGFLAEAMIFYQKVLVIADIGTLSQLAYEWGPALLNEFIKEDFLQIKYLEKRTTIVNYDNGLHRPASWVLPDGRWSIERVAPEVFSKAAGGPEYGWQLGKHFASLVETIDISDELLSIVNIEFSDQAYIEKAVKRLLSVIVPTYQIPHESRFLLMKVHDQYRISTNIDFRRVNAAFNNIWKTTGDFITPSSVLLHVFEARSDLFFASRENAEIATSPSNASILDTKFHEILNMRSKSQHDIEVFQEVELADSHEIGESLKKNYRSWREFLELLKQARKFKRDFLQHQKQDASLIHEYKKALEKDTWFGEQPTKFLRFLFFTLAETLLPLPLSIGLSTVDTFLVDRLVGGWKPNQFVNGPLKGFARLD